MDVGNGTGDHVQVVMEHEVVVVVAANAELGEGPVWDSRSGRLAWVHPRPPRAPHQHPHRGHGVDRVPLDIGAIAPRAAGGFVAAFQDGFWVVGDGPARRIATVPEARPGLRFNDGRCDPADRFWAGTMAYDETDGVASLYRLDPDGTVVRVLDGVTISNGLAWSDDGATMYYIDSPGRLDRVIGMPVSRPTSCAFGGPDLDELYGTSAWKGRSAADRQAEPLAGALFRLRPGVRGVAPSAFEQPDQPPSASAVRP